MNKNMSLPAASLRVVCDLDGPRLGEGLEDGAHHFFVFLFFSEDFF